MKRIAIYMRRSIADLTPVRHHADLLQFASKHGYEAVAEYIDHGVNGTKARRPALDRMLRDAAKEEFEAVLVLSCDRLARDTKSLLQILETLNRLGVQFLSLQDEIDTNGSVGAAIVLLISALARLDRSVKSERIRTGMRRAQMEGRRIGRAPLDVDHASLVRDRLEGMSLSAVARKYGLSRSSVVRFVSETLAATQQDD